MAWLNASYCFVRGLGGVYIFSILRYTSQKETTRRAMTIAYILQETHAQINQNKMQSASEGNLLEIIDLAHSLRQEHLYISNEQNTFLSLNDTLIKNSSNVAQLAWICAQQRQNLNSLILSRPDTGPSVCCQKANSLENTKFVDAHKAKGLKYQHVLAYIELFNFLHRSPYLLAQSLAIGDRLGRTTSDNMNSIVHTIATGLYGNAILSKDVDMVLRLLRELIEIQIVVSSNPRRMLRAGSCAFSRLYHRLHESLFSAKLFLTAALHEPVMKVLSGDDILLDIDTLKSVANFPQKIKLKKFGQEGTKEYDEAIKAFHNSTITSLFHLSKLFIQSLSDNWALFPSTLRWTALINKKEINDILTDMVFTNFICPAVVSPDLFGISDAPISENARFNLIQIGQILQMLALVKHEDIDAKYLELFEMFDRNLVSELMDQLLETEYDISVSMMAIPHQNDFGRRHVLVTQSELNIFVDFFRNVLDNDGLIISGDDRRKLGKVLDQLPDKWETVLNGSESQTVLASPEHMNKAKQSLINLGKSTKTKLAKTISLNVAGMNHNEHVDDSSTVLSNGNHNGSASKNAQLDYEQVLVIPIAIHEESKFQLLTEQEVLNMNNISNEIAPNTENLDELDKIGTDFNEVESGMCNRKHTRFSLSNDDQSIGNTSDNLEVVSEAQSNHSVTSSLEMEENDQNLNDNLSDMVSANVSGRGTPNISGRDTPSSQVTEGETPPIPPLQMAKILNKARSEIDEKFCKFEIKKLVEVDETISIISDTWSTDVLASDSETIEQPDGERNFSTPLIPSSVILPGDDNFDPLRGSGSRIRGGFLEGSDTRSESAWSTDVLASDSEKTTEIDTDDNQSITANSDITDAGRSESDLARDIEVPNRAPDSPFFAPRAPSSNLFRSPDLITFSQRPADYPSVRMFDESASRNGQSSVRLQSEELVRFLSPSSFQSRSRDDPNYSDANAGFRNAPYRGFDRDSFVNARIRRQNSAESSISNHSSNCDDGNSTTAVGSLAASLKRTNGADPRREYRFPDYPMDARTTTSDSARKSETNLINLFSDLEDVAGSSVDRSAINRNRSDNYSNVVVQHRRTSNDQRTASVDGRRNAMSANQARQAASISYENHEIITQKTSTLQIVPAVNSSATDDDKTNERNEFLLIQKTMSLNLNNDVQESNGDDFMNDDAVNRPSKYTGAIPKSISFDSSADKNDRSYLRRPDVVRSNGTSFFNKIKQGFKNRHSKKRGGQDDFTSGNGRSIGSVGLDGADASAVTNGFNGNEPISFFDTSEDILAKYRRKISSSSEATNSDSVGNPRKNSQSDIDQRNETGLLLDDSSYWFNNAKRKLRLVLSTTDLHTADFRHTSCHKTPPLLTYLQIQLAQALNLQNLQQISFVSEAIRCLNLLDPIQQRQLVAELQQDLIKRQSYLQYLMRYRQHLLSALENIDRFEDRLRNDRDMCNRHLIMVCVRMFLEKRETTIERFQEEFSTVNGG
ncbi:hypothetical protein HA402_006996 [Bradysia odoriphaga]|nr:hypothetical protein HA402_006996 [Bradysia odoriphaga]